MKSKGLEKILNILYKISLNPLGALGWRCVYACNYQAGKFWLRNFTGAQSVYLKGSYAKASWRPLISDIDFALVYEGSSGEEDAKKIAWLKKLLPIVRDIERFESKDFELRLKYGSYKYLDFSNWIKVSKGSPAFQTQRFSYPLKNLWDLVHELYFYVEWIQVNLNSSFNSYRQACARRALLKIAKLVAKFNDGFNWEGYLEQNPLESLETKEELLQWMFSCLEELGGAAFLVDKFLSSKDFDWNEILSRNYYQRRFQIVDVQNFKWNGEKNQLPFDLFKLFYSLGCIDSLVVYKFLSHTDDETLNSLVLIEYYQ
ncbi:MAG: nucleotidyltransferase domain-containing protein, partial [Bacteriovoracaceae bacterium]